MKTRLLFISVIILITVSGCWLVPVNYYDKKLKPFLYAISRVQRLIDSLGFSPVSEKAEITIEGKSGSYDAMLHIYQGISARTIAFRKQGDGYVWIGEQEIFTGPQEYKSVDGVFNETITLNYDREVISGNPLDTLIIDYAGPDSSKTSPNTLSQSEAQTLIKKWEIEHVNP